KIRIRRIEPGRDLLATLTVAIDVVVERIRTDVLHDEAVHADGAEGGEHARIVGRALLTEIALGAEKPAAREPGEAARPSRARAARRGRWARQRSGIADGRRRRPHPEIRPAVRELRV